MKFSVQKQGMVSAVNQVVGAVDGRSTLPILSHLLLGVRPRGAIDVTATDLEIFATSECDAEVPELGGQVCVPGRKIKDAIDAIHSDAIEFSLDRENLQMTIEGDGVRFTLSCLPAAEFPKGPDAGLEEDHRFEPGILPGLLGACAHAANQTGIKDRLAGIHLCRESDRLIAVATDGRRISLVGLSWDGVYALDAPITLPLKACKLISSVVGGIEFSVSEARLANFTSPGLSIRSGLIDGDYPNFRRVIETDYPYLTTVDRKRLIETLAACGVMSDDSGKTVKLEIGAAEQLTVSALGSAGSVEATIPCMGDDKLLITLPSRQLLQALKALEGDEVFLKYRDNLSPLLIFPADHGHWDERLELISAMRN